MAPLRVDVIRGAVQVLGVPDGLFRSLQTETGKNLHDLLFDDVPIDLQSLSLSPGARLLQECMRETHHLAPHFKKLVQGVCAFMSVMERAGIKEYQETPSERSDKPVRAESKPNRK